LVKQRWMTAGHISDETNGESGETVKRGKDAIDTWRRRNPRADLDLMGGDLRWTELSCVDLSGADMGRADLGGANLRQSNLSDTSLSGCDLSGADLGGADLSRADLSGVELRAADLSEADLNHAILIDADLQKANLSGAQLDSTFLRGANLSGADLSDARFVHAVTAATVWANVDLSTVAGLESIIHLGASTIGIDTLVKSKGRVPELFLRSCGVSKEIIESILPRARQGAIDFYSSFISYSHQDEDFAMRLHSRLQQEGLQVWYAPKDVRGGQKIHEQISDAIRMHDKLLLVLSEHSIASNWVEHEIRQTLKAEKEECGRKLFPIRLVDMGKIKTWKCFSADEGRDLAEEVREYYIADFSDWKDDDAFEAMFGRLLRDLRPPTAEPLGAE